MSPVKIADDQTWKTDTRENALRSSSVNLTVNGSYSARIASNADNAYGMTTFKISGLKNTTPLKAKVTSAKINSKKISGKCQAYMKVMVKYNNKLYFEKANKNGNWSITMGQKLKKGYTIKIVVKNSAGKSSKILSYKLK